MELTEEQLIDLHVKIDSLKKNFKGEKKYGFNLSAKSFALKVKFLNTQSYGLRVQSFFAYHLGFKLTPSSLDLGDFKTVGGHDIEFKCSFLDSNQDNINVKQIRNWQDLNYYYVFTIDFNDYRDIKFKCYELSKEQMINECILMNAIPTHNTKGNHHEKSSIGFSICVGSENYDRWEKQYLNNKFDIEKIVDESNKKINNSKNKDLILEQQAKLIKEMEEKIRQLEMKQVFELNHKYEELEPSDFIQIVREEKEDTNYFPAEEVCLSKWKANEKNRRYY